MDGDTGGVLDLLEGGIVIDGEIGIDIDYAIESERDFVICAGGLTTDTINGGRVVEPGMFELREDGGIDGGAVGTGIEEEIEFLIALIDGDDGHIGEFETCTKGNRLKAFAYRREMGMEG